MGHDAKIKAATRYARAAVKRRAAIGGELLSPAALEGFVPPALHDAIGNYRTIKRVCARALGLDWLKRNDDGRIIVTRTSHVARRRARQARELWGGF